MPHPARRRRPGWAVFWLVETGPLGFAIARTLGHGGDHWQLVAAVAGAALLSIGGSVARVTGRFGHATMTIGVGALLASIAPAVVTNPLLGFVLLVGSILLIARIWSPGIVEDLIGRRKSRLQEGVTDIRLAAVMALATWLFGVAARSELDPWIAGASATASLLAGVWALAWMGGVLGGRVRALWTALAGAAAIAAGVAAATGTIRPTLSVLALVPAATLLIARVRGVDIVDTGWTSLILDHPARLVVTTFLFLCAAGFVLLSLPVCAAGDLAVAKIDAAFTAVSAVCVTGLITVDTPHAWSGAGQVGVMLLIQLGGLGIMTLSTAALGAMGRRLSVRHEEAVAGLVSGQHRGRLFIALRHTLAITVCLEAAGAICLSILFWIHGDGFATGLWRGLFTSVSAFCNAGFSLQSDSLIAFQSSPAVLHTVGILIIAGGLSPAVIVALPQMARRKTVPVQAKIVVAATAGLLVFGFASFAAFEWNHALAGMSVVDRLHNAWFQSVTYRTAGFNSVDFAGIQSTTLVLSLLLMFVGGAPGGTAGGIKVTTAWVLGAAVTGSLGGRPEASSFARRIPHTVVYRAISITMLFTLVTAVIFTAVQLTQRMPASQSVFEVFSAMGTVGLSTGGTAELDGLGKILVMIAMFLGRVGPLTAFLLLSDRQVAVSHDQLEENVEVG